MKANNTAVTDKMRMLYITFILRSLQCPNVDCLIKKIQTLEITSVLILPQACTLFLSS
uniref:Uncharacterized protein n=1 Tax=Rhizophora mucronata TaxID=61149 RepID=A0A2P2NPS5_RHIMU